MLNKNVSGNKIITLLMIIYHFVISIISSLLAFIKHLFKGNAKPILENKFLDILNFSLHIGPKSFWKKPSGIKIGRSLATFIHYIFYKDEFFKERKKK